MHHVCLSAVFYNTGADSLSGVAAQVKAPNL